MKHCALPMIALASFLMGLWGSDQLRAQPRFPIPRETFTPTRLPAAPASVAVDTPSFYKRKPEWKKIIDAYWGPGVPVQEKRNIFNAYADYIERYCTVFEGLGISWDSLRSHYYAQITDSTSHGRFSAILSYLAYHLREPHIAVFDRSLHRRVVDGDTVRAVATRGTPLWYKTPMPDATHFGAVLTPLEDSSAVVIRAAENHPLGLKPGDVVLGYEGVPWRQIARELLAAEIPSFSLYGGSRTMETHDLLASAGFNWHLFDTIDIVKSHGGDTLHLPVDSLASFKMIDTIYNNQCLEVPGVPWPDWAWGISRDNVKPVSHGIVQGTNVGYVYVAQHLSRLRGDPSLDSEERFAQAIDELWETDGLIIDLREDQGGWVDANLNRGLARLLNFDTHTLSYWRRASGSDLTALQPWPVNFAFDINGMFIDADEESAYDKPIAVLVGPGCVSMGDITAYRTTYIPNTRFFGKPTSMGMAGFDFTGQRPEFPQYMLDTYASDVAIRDYHAPWRDIERMEFPVDERVWLTREDVLKGEDTVVKRALDWIRSVPHAHHVVASGRSLAPGLDTLRLKARVANPQGHALSVMATFRRDSTLVDSVLLADDGLHGDGAQGDGLWGALWKPPAEERFYSAAVRVFDPADASTFPMPYAARFTTAGPMTVDSAAFRMARPGQLRLSLVLRNRGQRAAVPSVQVKVTSLDSARYYFVTDTVAFGDVGPAEVARRIDGLTLLLRDPLYAGAKTVEVAIRSGEITYWTETLILTGVGSPPSAEALPVQYDLGQNYPNPFNPATQIRYQIPAAGHVRLSVYDLLGREVALLVDEIQMPGEYEVRFDAARLASGVYVYRMSAGSYVRAQKMIVAK